MKLFDKLFGTYSERQIKKLEKIANEIESLAEKYSAMTDEELLSLRNKLLNELKQEQK